jgi:hypothetical protein
MLHGGRKAVCQLPAAAEVLLFQCSGFQFAVAIFQWLDTRHRALCVLMRSYTNKKVDRRTQSMINQTRSVIAAQLSPFRRGGGGGREDASAR